MSWITVIWSATAAICLTLAGVHFLVWAKSRESLANLLFSISAASASSCAGFELSLMHAQTPEQYGEILRWFHVPLAVLVVSLIWFVRHYLRAGRLWLLWLFCALRVVTLALTFSLDPNLNFREITGLNAISAWGETIVSPIGVKNPWTNITHASGVVLLVFVVDAAIGAWRKGQRRRSLVVGGTFGMAILVAVIFSELMDQGGASIPFTLSLVFLIIILGMAYELSLDLLNANRLAQALENNQKRLSLATSAANLGVWEWDVNRDELWLSDTIRSRIGLGEHERPNLERFLQLLHPDDREEIGKAVHQVLEGGKDYQAEYRSIDRKGNYRWISSRGQAERDANGKPLRVHGVSVDITERKQAEAEAKFRQAELAHISRVSTVGELTSSLAHELNQPLGAILRNAEAAELLLGKASPDFEELMDIVKDIQRDDQRAGAVIDRMRLLLKKRDIRMDVISLNDVIKQAVGFVAAEMQQHGVVLDVESEADLPQVRGDVVHLQQVLLNLLNNALDSVKGLPENRQLSISVRRTEPRMLEVAVRDRGPGIPEEQLKRIFDPFFSTKNDGLGIGLAISNTIIEAHGGRIWAENNPFGGATVRFTLLVAQPETIE